MASPLHPTQLTIRALQSPLPDSLEEAQEEIVRLRKQLIQQNEARGNAAIKYECDKRSLTGQVALLQAMLKQLKDR